MKKSPTALLTTSTFRPRQIRDEIVDLEGRLTKAGGRANYEVSVMMQKLRRELREITRLRLVSYNDPAPAFTPWVCPSCKKNNLRYVAHMGVAGYFCEACEFFQQPHPSIKLATRIDVLALRDQLKASLVTADPVE